VQKFNEDTFTFLCTDGSKDYQWTVERTYKFVPRGEGRRTETTKRRMGVVCVWAGGGGGAERHRPTVIPSKSCFAEVTKS
jgi:hypothetical protein